MIRIVVNRDVVALPIPVADVVVVEGCNLKRGILEPKALAVSPFDSKDEAGTEPKREVSLRPGVIDVVPGVVPPCVVTNPRAIARMYVRSARVVRQIANGMSGAALRGTRAGASRCGTVFWNVAVADLMGRPSRLPPSFLRKRDQGQSANEPGEQGESSHDDLH